MNNIEQPTEEQAIDYTTNWRMYYDKFLCSINPERKSDPNSTDIFRGFRIPINDLEALLDDAGYTLTKKEHAPDIDFVRTYLAIKNEAMDLIIVPVSKLDEQYPNGADILSMTIDGKPKCTIYDFTTPCPTQCDTSSPLYKYEKNEMPS